MPLTLSYNEGEPIRPGYHVETRPRTGLLIGGIAGVGAFYILGALLATDNSVTGNEVGFVPIIGPFIAAGTLEHVPSGEFIDFDFSGVDRLFFLLSGAGQTAGLVLAVFALASPRKILVRGGAPAAAWSIAPVAAPGFAGLNLVGSM